MFAIGTREHCEVWVHADGGVAAVMYCFFFLYLIFSGAGDWSLGAGDWSPSWRR